MAMPILTLLFNKINMKKGFDLGEVPVLLHLCPAAGYLLKKTTTFQFAHDLPVAVF